MNPYSLAKEWCPQTREAYLAMPKNNKGYTISLFFIEDKDVPRMEEAWREWAKVHASGKNKWLQPVWFKKWADYKKFGIKVNSD